MAWSKRAVEWIDGSQAYISVVFTWDLPKAWQRAVWLKAEGYSVKAGGPAVALMPDYLADVAECGGEIVGCLQRHNPLATKTSMGCIRACPFCGVSRSEGGLRELDEWPILPIVSDNNLLACSRAHFDRVIDSLKPLKKIDFNGGLDARLLTVHHADRLAELDCLARLAFDSMECESRFMRAYERLRAAGFPKSRIRVYVLIGYDDTPEDALYRLRTIMALGVWPTPMRYQPLDTLQKNSFIHPAWTSRELKDYMRYWSRLRFFRNIPFEEYQQRRSLGLSSQAH